MTLKGVWIVRKRLEEVKKAKKMLDRQCTQCVLRNLRDRYCLLIEIRRRNARTAVRTSLVERTLSTRFSSPTLTRQAARQST